MDLTDVAVYARKASQVTGIQRVQLEVARRLLRHPNVQAFALLDRRAQDVSHLLLAGNSNSRESFDSFVQLAGQRSFFSRSQSDASSWLRSLLRRDPLSTLDIANLALTADDVLYIGGAFWDGRDSLPLYEFAASIGVSLVAFVHDVIPLTHPTLTGPYAVPLFHRLLNLPLHVVTPSEFSRQDILKACKQFDLPNPQSMQVIPLAHEYPGVARNAPGPLPSERLRKLLGTRPFILTVGTVEVRKNQELLLKTWENLASAPAAVPPLVVAGAAGWMASSIVKSLRRAGAGAPYVFVEAPTDGELEWLYRRCLFTVFASKVEGWGLPVGESLWFGKPCVTTRTASLPEVGGELCDYIDDFTPEGMAKGVMHLLKEEEYRVAKAATISNAALRTWNRVSTEIANYVETLRQ